MASSILVVTPAHLCDPTLAIAAVRAGERGFLDLGIGSDEAARREALTLLADRCGERREWGVRWDAFRHGMPRALTALRTEPIPWLWLAGVDDWERARLQQVLEQARSVADRVLVEVSSERGALQLAGFDCDGLLLKGSEAGGRIGTASSFLLLQRLHGRLQKPYWIQGAWGLQTAAAARLAGAEGVALSEELWLARESPIGHADRRRYERLDGSETLTVGDEEVRFRFFAQQHRSEIEALRTAFEHRSPWPDALRSVAASHPIPMGQGIAFAARLARRHVTVGGILAAYRESTAELLRLPAEQRSLAPNSPSARDLGTRYPILQGPMTRVSDVTPFGEAVARNGGLPFMALALMSGEESDRLLQATSRALEGRSWGVGILGFVPPELRAEQIEAIRRARPPFALIAGGRPSQARELEALGIATFLHVPSPGLLESFIEQGARRFVLEGRECGGHVGPRPSFTLWQSAIDVLLDADPESLADLRIVFAGGVHDALSAAMVQTIAAPLVARGVLPSVLMGTAYIFTHEAVNCGAITPVFQEHALGCRETTLLVSGLGHATRCAKSAFADEFNARRRELQQAGAGDDRIRFELEMLNVGRLRIASKGLARVASADDVELDPDDLQARGRQLLKGRMQEVDAEVQRRDGMFMIGEVATLRGKTLSVAELHEQVSQSGTESAIRLACRAMRVPADAAAWFVEPPEEPRPAAEPIAIIGIDCRFPHAANLSTFWKNILNRYDAVREVSPERWNPEQYYSSERFARDRVYSKWGGFLDPVRFDPLAFSIPPASLAQIEPVQLLTLQVAFGAVADAGYASRPFARDRTAVIFASGGVNDVGMGYAIRTMLPHYLNRVSCVDEPTKARIVEELRDQLPEWTEDSFPGFLANVIAGRVANRLDLRGPNFVVDAACAASLAAVDTAVAKLRARSIDMALVGGSDATNNIFVFTSFAKTHALTPSGKIRPFDERADGIVLGEGVAAVMLKRLSDAERDGDRIYALIRGIGSSSDGRNRSLTAPHPASQTLAIERAYADADVDPQSVTLIEAHATGTAVGDRAEIAAMKAVFESADRTEPFCAVGSVKSMIGHGKTVAGMAGLIKTAMALKHRVLPPTLHVEQPNRAAEFDSSPFYINSETRPWIRPASDTPRRAGLSAFGFGGTNFHVVLEEYMSDFHDSSHVDLAPRAAELFLWRREDRNALRESLEKLTGSIPAGIDLAQLAYALHLEESQRSTVSGGVRLAIVAGSRDDLESKLRRALEAGASDSELDEPGLYLSDAPAASAAEVAFLYPGQGAQHVDMLKDLVQYGPFGMELIEHADRLLADLLPRRLSSYIYPRPTFDKAAAREVRQALDDTRIAQPAIGLMSILCTDLLERFGITAAAAAGHSYGEHVALAACGLLSHDDLLRSSAIRGLAVHEAGADHPGGMAAVAASESETREALESLGIPATIANVNAPRQVVIAGPVDAIETAQKRLPELGLAIRRVAVTAAFHSSAMEQPSISFGEHLEKLEMHAPRIPVYSNVTAEPYPPDVESIRRQMSIHLARPVRWVDQIRAMYNRGARIFIEVGPGRILTGLVRRILEDRAHLALSVDRPGQPGWLTLGELLGRLHALGLEIDAAPWFAKRGLQATASADALEQARLEEKGKPTDWIVETHGSHPVIPLPTGKRAPAVKLPATAAAAPTEAHTPATPKATAMKHDRPIEHPVPPIADVAPRPAEDSALLHRLSESMSGWLELQRDQQRLNERFLAIQERLVEGVLGRGETGLRAPRPLTANPGLRVAPAPVLPHGIAKAAAPTAAPAAASDSPPPPLAASIEAPPSSATLSDGDDELGSDHFRADLLDEISRRTGYPEEMLDLDAQLEAGLGIDSIKTMEIFGALKRYHPILSGEAELDEDVLVQLSQMKTLREIVQFYGVRLEETRAGQRPVAALPAAPPTVPPQAAESAPVATSSGHEHSIERLVLRTVAAPHAEARPMASLAGALAGASVLILGEPPELAAALAAGLTASGIQVTRVVPGKGLHYRGDRLYEADLGDRELVERLAERVRGAQSTSITGIVNLLGLADPMNRPGLNGTDSPLRLMHWLANVARAFEKDLRPHNGTGGGWIVNVTSLDGRFGLSGEGDLAVAQAGSLGFFKSLAREWKGIRVKNLDLHPAADVRSAVVGLMQELSSPEGPLEVGIDSGGRWHLELVADELTSTGSTPLDGDSVLLATGGADGITAEVVKRLAAESGCRVILCGRTDPGDGEDRLTADWRDEVAVRRGLIEHMRARDSAVSPAQIEQEVQRVLKRRRVRENLEAMRDVAAGVEYHVLDVRDTQALGELIDSLYDRFGRIDGVLHGAGVVEDGWLRDKTADSFERVFQTKALSAHLLAKRLRPASLRFLVFFSSVSGRFGNAGQTDYSAANEYLNKLAAHLDREWPGRVVSINWGPWDAGMVSDGLRAAYASRGIELIDINEGTRSLLAELSDPSGCAEVVLTRTPWQIAESDATHA